MTSSNSSRQRSRSASLSGESSSSSTSGRTRSDQDDGVDGSFSSTSDSVGRSTVSDSEHTGSEESESGESYGSRNSSCSQSDKSSGDDSSLRRSDHSIQDHSEFDVAENEEDDQIRDDSINEGELLLTNELFPITESSQSSSLGSGFSGPAQVSNGGASQARSHGASSGLIHRMDTGTSMLLTQNQQLEASQDCLEMSINFADDATDPVLNESESNGNHRERSGSQGLKNDSSYSDGSRDSKETDVSAEEDSDNRSHSGGDSEEPEQLNSVERHDGSRSGESLTNESRDSQETDFSSKGNCGDSGDSYYSGEESKQSVCPDFDEEQHDGSHSGNSVTHGSRDSKDTDIPAKENFDNYHHSGEESIRSASLSVEDQHEGPPSGESITNGSRETDISAKENSESSYHSAEETKQSASLNFDEQHKGSQSGRSVRSGSQFDDSRDLSDRDQPSDDPRAKKSNRISDAVSNDSYHSEEESKHSAYLSFEEQLDASQSGGSGCSTGQCDDASKASSDQSCDDSREDSSRIRDSGDNDGEIEFGDSALGEECDPPLNNTMPHLPGQPVVDSRSGDQRVAVTTGLFAPETSSDRADIDPLQKISLGTVLPARNGSEWANPAFDDETGTGMFEKASTERMSGLGESKDGIVAATLYKSCDEPGSLLAEASVPSGEAEAAELPEYEPEWNAESHVKEHQHTGEQIETVISRAVCSLTRHAALDSESIRELGVNDGIGNGKGCCNRVSELQTSSEASDCRETDPRSGDSIQYTVNSVDSTERQNYRRAGEATVSSIGFDERSSTRDQSPTLEQSRENVLRKSTGSRSTSDVKADGTRAHNTDDSDTSYYEANAQRDVAISSSDTGSFHSPDIGDTPLRLNEARARLLAAYASCTDMTGNIGHESESHDNTSLKELVSTSIAKTPNASATAELQVERAPGPVRCSDEDLTALEIAVAAGAAAAAAAAPEEGEVFVKKVNVWDAAEEDKNAEFHDQSQFGIETRQEEVTLQRQIGVKVQHDDESGFLFSSRISQRENCLPRRVDQFNADTPFVASHHETPCEDRSYVDCYDMDAEEPAGKGNSYLSDPLPAPHQSYKVSSARAELPYQPPNEDGFSRNVNQGTRSRLDYEAPATPLTSEFTPPHIPCYDKDDDSLDNDDDSNGLQDPESLQSAKIVIPVKSDEREKDSKGLSKSESMRICTASLLTAIVMLSIFLPLLLTKQPKVSSDVPPQSLHPSVLVASSPTPIPTAHPPVEAPTIPPQDAPSTSTPSMKAPSSLVPSPTAESPSPAMSSFPTNVPATVSYDLVGGPFTGTFESTVGHSVAISSSVMAMGEVAESGMVKTYWNEFSIWRELSDISGTESGSLFGYSLCMTKSDLSILVGAPASVKNGTTTSVGSAFYFELDTSNNNWQQLGSQIRGEEDIFAANEAFGTAVAASDAGRVLAVGAPYSSELNIIRGGRVYTFEFNTALGDWIPRQAASLTGDQAEANLGMALDISSDGSVLIAGGPGRNSESGYVLVLIWDGYRYVPVSTIEGESSGDLFGSSVQFLSSDGSYFAVGAPGHNGGQGSISVYFRQEDGTFSILGSLLGYAGDRLGARDSIASGSDWSQSATLAVLACTLTGMVRRFQYSFSAGTWEDSTSFSSGLSDPVAIASSMDGANLVVSGNNQAGIYARL